MEEKGNLKIPLLSEIDVLYLTEEQRSLLEEEMKREKPNIRVFKILKRFASISKRVEGLTTYFKGFHVDTDAMDWVLWMYQNTPPNTENYEILQRVVSNYTKAQVWLGYFFSMVNALNHNLNMRRLTAAEKNIRRMELEVERARRIFSRYNESLKELRNSLAEREEMGELEYFK